MVNCKNLTILDERDQQNPSDIPQYLVPGKTYYKMYIKSCILMVGGNCSTVIAFPPYPTKNK